MYYIVFSDSLLKLFNVQLLSELSIMSNALKQRKEDLHFKKLKISKKIIFPSLIFLHNICIFLLPLAFNFSLYSSILLNLLTQNLRSVYYNIIFLTRFVVFIF